MDVSTSFTFGETSLKPDIVAICNPTEMHIDTAIAWANEGCHLFIEKPLDVSSRRLAELENILEKKNLTAYVAYPLRFLPDLTEEKHDSYLGSFGFIDSAKFVCRTDASKWPTKKRKLNHVVWELSHEIDLAEYLLGPIRAIRGDADSDGLRASLRLEHVPGGVSWVDLDMGSPVEERYYALFDGTPGRVDVHVTNEIYVKQWQWYFGAAMHELRVRFWEACRLFRQMEEFVCRHS